MKETNMEHFRGEIEAAEYRPALVDGKIQKCMGTPCRTCSFYTSAFENCNSGRIYWLMSEYKEEPVLTQREKGFVECMDDGWIARDLYGCLHWFEEKPTKEGGDWWEVCCVEEGHAVLKEHCFPFITWEDEEPWSVEELRKLKVENED